MKLLIIALALFVFPFVTLASAQGVMSGSTWKNSAGKEVTVDLVAETSGNLRVTLTDKNGATGSTSNAHGSASGGCAKSGEVAVGQDRYRIRNGRVQWLGPGGWVDMHQPGFVVLCAPGDPTVGTLPY